MTDLLEWWQSPDGEWHALIPDTSRFLSCHVGHSLIVQRPNDGIGTSQLPLGNVKCSNCKVMADTYLRSVPGLVP